MNEMEISTIKEDLAKLQADVKRILECLQGNIEDSMHGDLGLIPEHRQCRGQVKGMMADISDLRDKYEDLANYKRQVLAYAGGALAVISIGWEIVHTFILK